MGLSLFPELSLSRTAMDVISGCKKATFAGSVEQLVAMAVPDTDEVRQAGGYYDVNYDVPGQGSVTEARVCKVRNGIAANYLDPYMRRRDPDCMVIGDQGLTDKPKFADRFNSPFEPVRQETFAWLKSQELVYFFFESGLKGHSMVGLAICPANAGFFALGLAMLQGIMSEEQVLSQGKDFFHGAVVYVAPPFRHTHFEGKQLVVHNRRHSEADLHELFSYNLYPGPSAKKGVYGMLLAMGENDEEQWTTAHCSTVQAVTPYDNTVTIMHEGASGGGKSEMLEQMHREADGRLKFARNTLSDDIRYFTLPRGCKLNPVTDDMALCHPELQHEDDRFRKLSLTDAEQAWFIRVNHINQYGTDPHLEQRTIHPPGPLLFLNIDVVPHSTALIWEHVQDEPGKSCPNPRVIVPRAYIPDIVNEPVTVDIRSFGVRCPPCTKEDPTYGIIGMFHVLPPALAWLWRLVAPRGHGNPSIVDQGGMQSEGVGSYWPFATGRRVDQANILLEQIMETADTLFVLIPNQHIGCWQVGFAPQWVAREYLARRGSAPFNDGDLKNARCPLLGYHRESLLVEDQTIGSWFFDVSKQPEVTEAGYDKGAAILTEFFHTQLAKFDHKELLPQGKAIIQACLNNASVADYAAFTES